MVSLPEISSGSRTRPSALWVRRANISALSGTSTSMADGLGRLLLTCLYLTVQLAALGAIGLLISTLTEQPMGATIALTMLTVASFVLLQARDVVEAIRLRAHRLRIWRAGELLAHAPEVASALDLPGRPSSIGFTRDAASPGA